MWSAATKEEQIAGACSRRPCAIGKFLPVPPPSRIETQEAPVKYIAATVFLSAVPMRNATAFGNRAFRRRKPAIVASGREP